MLNTTEEIENELSKPIDSSKLLLTCAFPSHLELVFGIRLIVAVITINDKILGILLTTDITMLLTKSLLTYYQ